MYSLGIDLGGSKVKLGYLCSGEMLGFDSFEIPSGTMLAPLLPELKARALRLVGKETKLGGVGIAYPGLVDFANRRASAGNGKYDDADSIDLAGWVAESFGCGCIVDNDANAALLGEVGYGCAKGERDAAMLILGTGVGTAAMMDGKLVRGKHFQAGCLGGHFPVEIAGRSCTCGGRGCVEANASSRVLGELIRKHPDYSNSPLRNEEKLDFKTLGKYLSYRTAADVLNHCVKVWANCIISLVYAYDPETVILSGGVTRLGGVLTEPLIAAVRENVWTPWGELNFKIAENGEHSVLLGLSSLAEEYLQ